MAATMAGAFLQESVDPFETSTLELTIPMPCLNEAGTVATCFRMARSFLQRTGLRSSVTFILACGKIVFASLLLGLIDARTAEEAQP